VTIPRTRKGMATGSRAFMVLLVQAVHLSQSIADAVEITQFAGAVTSYSTNPATEWHLWIKWESIDGVLSV